MQPGQIYFKERYLDPIIFLELCMIGIHFAKESPHFLKNKNTLGFSRKITKITNKSGVVVFVLHFWYPFAEGIGPHFIRKISCVRLQRSTKSIILSGARGDIWEIF